MGPSIGYPPLVTLLILAYKSLYNPLPELGAIVSHARSLLAKP
jgi:hypothetical protein